MNLIRIQQISNKENLNSYVKPLKNETYKGTIFLENEFYSLYAFKEALSTSRGIIYDDNKDTEKQIYQGDVLINKFSCNSIFDLLASTEYTGKLHLIVKIDMQTKKLIYKTSTKIKLINFTDLGVYKDKDFLVFDINSIITLNENDEIFIVTGFSDVILPEGAIRITDFIENSFIGFISDKIKLYGEQLKHMNTSLFELGERISKEETSKIKRTIKINRGI